MDSGSSWTDLSWLSCCLVVCLYGCLVWLTGFSRRLQLGNLRAVISCPRLWWYRVAFCSESGRLRFLELSRCERLKFFSYTEE